MAELQATVRKLAQERVRPRARYWLPRTTAMVTEAPAPVYSPVYDAYGNYIGQQLVNVC